MHNIEAEKSFLCCLFIDDTIINHSLSLIDKSYFYKPLHQNIFEAINFLHKKEMDIDIVSVNNVIKNNGEDIPTGYISELMDTLPTAVNYETYADIIYTSFLKRSVLEVFKESHKKIKDIDIFDLITEINGKLDKMTKSKYKEVSLSEQISDALKYMQESKNKAGLRTGFEKLDKTYCGLRGGELHIISGRPSAGKSAFVLNIVTNITKQDPTLPIIFYSLEMHAREHIFRIISKDKKLPYSKIRSGMLNKIDYKIIVDSANTLNKTNLIFPSESHISVDHVKRKAIDIKTTKGKLGAIVIDHLGLMTGDKKKSRYELITDITRELKLLALKLDVPIILLSQLNRAIEQRSNEEPRLSDLRDSGSAEQDADTVSIFTSASPTDKTLYVLKNRNGMTNKIDFKFNGEYMTFNEKVQY